MQKRLKKLAIALGAGMLMLPVGVQAQTADNTGDTPAAGTEGAVESNENVASDSDSSRAQDNAQASDNSDASQADAKPDQDSAYTTKPRDLPKAMEASKSSREARKEAMRSLSNTYPADAVATQDATPAPVQASDSPITSRVIPAASKATVYSFAAQCA